MTRKQILSDTTAIRRMPSDLRARFACSMMNRPPGGAMQRVIGPDIHKDTATYAMVALDGQRLRSGTFAATPEAIERFGKSLSREDTDRRHGYGPRHLSLPETRSALA